MPCVRSPWWRKAIAHIGQRMLSFPSAVVSSASLMTAKFYAIPHKKDHKIFLRLWLTLPFAPLTLFALLWRDFLRKECRFSSRPRLPLSRVGALFCLLINSKKTLLICHHFIQRPPWVSVARGNVARYRGMGNAWNDVEREMRGNADNPQEKVAVHKGSEIKGRADHRLWDY